MHAASLSFANDIGPEQADQAVFCIFVLRGEEVIHRIICLNKVLTLKFRCDVGRWLWLCMWNRSLCFVWIFKACFMINVLSSRECIFINSTWAGLQKYLRHNREKHAFMTFWPFMSINQMVNRRFAGLHCHYYQSCLRLTLRISSCSIWLNLQTGKNYMKEWPVCSLYDLHPHNSIVSIYVRNSSSQSHLEIILLCSMIFLFSHHCILGQVDPFSLLTSACCVPDLWPHSHTMSQTTQLQFFPSILSFLHLWKHICVIS